MTATCNSCTESWPSDFHCAENIFRWKNFLRIMQSLRLRKRDLWTTQQLPPLIPIRKRHEMKTLVEAPLRQMQSLLWSCWTRRTTRDLLISSSSEPKRQEQWLLWKTWTNIQILVACRKSIISISVGTARQSTRIDLYSKDFMSQGRQFLVTRHPSTVTSKNAMAEFNQFAHRTRSLFSWFEILQKELTQPGIWI